MVVENMIHMKPNSGNRLYHVVGGADAGEASPIDGVEGQRD